MPVNLVKRFLKLEAAGGILLFFAAVIAIILNNSPWTHFYTAFLAMPVAVHMGALHLAKPLLMWINDGLMVLFFLSVGLELKREILRGHLASAHNIILPAVAALGGMIVPALIYFAVNAHHPVFVKGWAIPVATDIAFALGILSLLGSRVPTPLKLFLLTATIFDDIGAIIIIAVFHTTGLSAVSLIVALCAVIILILLNRFRVHAITPYALVGIVLWVAVLKSGVHATLAGIILALTIPVNTGKEGQASPLHRLENLLLPWVSFAVLPIFAFANAGVSFSGVAPGAFSNGIAWGIILGLFIGKQVGIFVFTWVLVKLRISHLPKQVRWIDVYSVGVLCGIGFTMSLFIGTLAFGSHQSPQMVSVRFGVLIASILSGILGYCFLFMSLRKRQHVHQPT